MIDNKFTIKKLNIRQIIVIYNRCLKQDFPVNERRPLLRIIKGILEEKYECIGAFYKGRLLGYAFFVKHDNTYLWDYLAVLKRYRCNGVGTKIVEAIKDYYKMADSIIGEVEDPAFAKDDEERKLMTRRLNFYLRNGCIDTGVRAITFGVHFIIIQILDKKIENPEVARLYKIYYREFLPEKVFEKNIKIK